MIPVYILGLSLYKWGLNIVENEISLSTTTQVNYFLNTFESEVKRIKDLLYKCLFDEDLIFLANASQSMSDFEKTQSLMRLQRRLDIMKNSSLYIDDVFAYIPSIQKVISTINGISNNIDEVIEISNIKPDNSDSQLIYFNDELFLIAKYPPINISSKNYPIFVILVKLSNRNLNNLLIFNDREGSGTILLNIQHNYVLSNSKDSDTIEQIAKFVSIGNETYEDIIKTQKIGYEAYLIVNKKSDFLNMQIVTYTPEKLVYGRLKSYQMLFVFFSLISFIMILIFAFSIRRTIHKPILKLANAFEELQDGNMDISIQHKGKDEFQYLYESFNTTVSKLNDLINQVYKQKILTQHAELKQLQAQINPHFLYNCFFIISRMARLEDYKNIIVFTEHLGNYYQFITHTFLDEIPLLKEVEHAKTYMDIQLMRFSNRIQVEIGDLPDKYKDIKVPPLIIQPIIENAFEHGLKDKEEDGIIHLLFSQQINGISIIIEDNGTNINDDKIIELVNILKDTNKFSDSTGIVNIHKRIQLKFGENSGISIKRSEIGGLRVEIQIIADRGEK